MVYPKKEKQSGIVWFKKKPYNFKHNFDLHLIDYNKI